MKIIFIGTVNFSKILLEQLIKRRADIVGIITQKSSSFNADFCDLGGIASLYNIPVLYTSNVNNPECITWMKQLTPEVVFCFGWSSLLKKEILSIAPKGVVGYHPAALPQYRGRHPIIWALALGLKQTASTFFIMDEGADNGDIVSQEFIDISHEDDAQLLYQKLLTTALAQLDKLVIDLQNNTYIRKPQQHEVATYWRKRGKRDGEINFKMNSNTIYNLVKALTHPYVGAHLTYGDKDVKIWKVKEQQWNEAGCEPGKILDVQNNEILVKTADAAIWIIKHEFDTLPLKGSYIL